MALSHWDFIYTFILLSYIAVGIFVRTLKNPSTRKHFVAFLGFFTLLLFCRKDAIFALTVISGTIGIIKLNLRYGNTISFCFIFFNLFIFRWALAQGVVTSPALSNAFHLILTVKLVSVAFEVDDFRVKKSTKVPEGRFELSLVEEPSAWDIWCYANCYIGAFTGPFFKFRTFYDFLHLSEEVRQTIPMKAPLRRHMSQIALFLAVFLLTSTLFSVDYVKTDEFYNHSFLYRLFYMVPIFLMGRMRFNMAWMLSECSFITAACGAYPRHSRPKPGHGPTVDPDASGDRTSHADEYVFTTIKNIDPYECEFGSTIRGGMRHWNMTVQWWLVNFVHKRVPKTFPYLRVPAVMLVSAYWHGTHAGYFASFLSMPLFMLAEDSMSALVRKSTNNEFILTSYKWFNWFFKMRSFEYMFMAFSLLTYEHTIRYWSSIYFLGHVVVIATILLCTIILRSIHNPDAKSK